MAPDPLGAAMQACPFLKRMQAAQGEAYARNLALNPFANASAGPLLLEDGLSSFAATLKLFHGPRGVVPLKRFGDTAPVAAATTAAPASGASSGCPFQRAAHPAASAPAAHTSSSNIRAAQPCVRSSGAAPPPAPRVLAGAPFASMSLSGFGFLPDPGQFLPRPPRSKKQRSQQQQRKPADPGTSTSGSSSGSSSGSRSGAPGPATGGSSGTGSGTAGRANAASTSSSSRSPGVSSPGGAPAGKAGSAGGGSPGQPTQYKGWGQVFGGLIPLTASGHLQCPSAIIKMRAAIAALKPVKQLRPQAMPVRAVAMSATAIAANLPAGAWREHTKKFSPQWFLAVHATIPFVAMLRKAVLMPKWAILITVIGAIAGQTVGARWERARLLQLTSPPPATASSAPAASSASRAASSPAPATLPSDCIMPGLDAGCRRCLQSAQSAVAWTLAPTVVR